MINSHNLLEAKYLEALNGLVLNRFHVLIPLAVLLHMGFYAIDLLSYPAFSPFFLKIRIIDSIAIVFLYLFSFKAKNHILLFTNLVALIITMGMAIMVYATDGSSSRYYEGLNLTVLGVFFINPYFVKSNILLFISQILIFQLAMFLSPHSSFNKLNFIYGSFFMYSSALVVALMTMFYSRQHRNAFMRAYQLHESEKQLASMYHQADHLAKIDELTNVYNRRHFFDLLNIRMRLAQQRHQNFYLVIFDIDFFKEINDQYGHAFGDNVLIKVSSLVRSNIRSNDFIGRYGGDEFVIFIDNVSRDILVRRLEKITSEIKALNLESANQIIHVSASFGAALFKPDSNLSDKTLLEAADHQLLLVKQKNRGTYSVQE